VVMPKILFHRILVILVDLGNIASGLFAIVVYFLNFDEIQTALRNTKLIRLVVPSIGIINLLIFVRMITFIHLFIVIPRVNKDNTLAGRYKNEVKHKFPIVTLK